MLYLAADHGGFKLKEALKRSLNTSHVTFEDLSPDYNSSDDYPLHAWRVAEAVRKGKGNRGLLICTTGVGMAIVANRVPGVRAALVADVFDARRSRQDEDCNVLVLAAHDQTAASGARIVKAWTRARFRGVERYKRRLKQIGVIERSVRRGDFELKIKN